MDPLFIKQAKFEKVSRKLLSQDATKWTKEILDEFFTEFPFFMSQNIDLQYKKKDEEKGYAVATIAVGDLAVPVIVSNFSLSPFDIVYTNGITLPLTEETLGSLFNSNTAFKQVVAPDRADSSLGLLFQRPLVDLQPNTPFGKEASVSVIDRISDTITKEHKKELLEKLSSDKSIIAGFELNGTIDVLAKIANIIPKPENYFKDSLSKVLPRDIHILEKRGRFKWELKEGNSGIYDPVVTKLDNNQAEDLINSSDFDVIESAGQEIEKKAEFKHKKGAAFEIEGLKEKLIIMNVEGIRKYAYANDIKTSTPEHCGNTFNGEMPQLNDYGVWISNNKASKPFEIVGITKSAQHYEIKAFDGMSSKSFIPIRSVDTVTPHETFDNTYYVPAAYKFVKIGESVEIEKAGKYHEKVSTNYYTKDDVGLYSLQGPVFEKYATEAGVDVTSMNSSEAMWAALQCLASRSEVEKMGHVPTNVHKPFESDLKSPVSLEKASELLSKEYKTHSATIKNLAQNLVKEASTLSDPNSVDAILALNMITKENILEFVYELPTFEQVLSNLAKLLLTVRLGLSTVPEAAVERSMKGLSTVVEMLRGLSRLDKVKTRD